MHTLNVDLGARSYPIEIGADLDAGALIRKALPKVKQVMVVSNETVAPLYYGQLKDKLQASGFSAALCEMKDGEKYKTAESYLEIMTALLEHGFSRDGALIALGGGVVGDVCGFAASTYQRGIAFVQVPTTLLAMVDSSVGGKTAINHPLGKNMIGTFYQPRCVTADISTLKTLPKREMAAGLAEVIKYGIIYDKDFFEYLYERRDILLNADADTISYIVRRCCEIKALVVAQDEQEHGLRAILNLGHTFGHAIEKQLGFGTFLHGEAVAVGMNIACTYAFEQGRISAEDLQRIQDLLKACELPYESPKGLTAAQYIESMHHDKKVRDGKIVYVIPTELGRCAVFKLSDEEIAKFLEEKICR